MISILTTANFTTHLEQQTVPFSALVFPHKHSRSELNAQYWVSNLTSELKAFIVLNEKRKTKMVTRALHLW